MFAKVIVDIRHEEVNHEFDYIIPQEFEDFLVRGMRVLVPFGTQTRLGYVFSVLDQSDSATKEIIEVLDVIPSISEELFTIVEHIMSTSPQLISSVLMTVMPSELLMNYQKVAKLLDASRCPEDMKDKFNKKGIWKLLKKDQVFYPKLKRLSHQGIITLETFIKAKEHIKTETIYQYSNKHQYSRIHHYPDLELIFRDSTGLSKHRLNDQGLSDGQIKTLIKHEVLKPIDQEVMREIHHVFDINDVKVVPTKEQHIAIKSILKHLHESHTFLVKGITGSGKTEVYMQVMEKVIKEGKQILYLVPEITLIGPMAQRLKSRFRDVAIYHSGLSKGERFDQYRMVKEQKASILLGTRSAVFLPLEHLGLIVIDEEHDDAYQQLDGVIYHAKDIAQLKSNIHQIPLILGSATPSVVSMYRANQDEYTLLQLTERPKALPLPKLHFIDMKEELKHKNTSIFSSLLLEKMKDRLLKK